jgi:hypothetical protein
LSDQQTEEEVMGAYSLYEKRFETAKKKVHGELVNYFVDIEEQKNLWHFTLAIRSLVTSRDLTNHQARSLTGQLVDIFSITRANIEAARMFMPFQKQSDVEKSNIVQLKKVGISDIKFEDHLDTLEFFFYERTFQYRQGLDMLLLVLSYYPDCEKMIARSSRKLSHRKLATN